MNESERLAYVAREYLAGRYGNLTTTEIEECREAEEDLRRFDAKRRKDRDHE
jgi:hypothetical protein